MNNPASSFIRQEILFMPDFLLLVLTQKKQQDDLDFNYWSFGVQEFGLVIWGVSSAIKIYWTWATWEHAKVSPFAFVTLSLFMHTPTAIHCSVFSLIHCQTPGVLILHYFHWTSIQQPQKVDTVHWWLL